MAMADLCTLSAWSPMWYLRALVQASNILVSDASTFLGALRAPIRVVRLPGAAIARMTLGLERVEQL